MMRRISEEAKEKIQIMLAFTDHPEIKDELNKAKVVEYELVDGVLYARSIGSNDAWEVRKSARTGEIYCTCPRYKFRKRFGLASCKHITAMVAEGVEIPVYLGKSVFGVQTGQ